MRLAVSLATAALIALQPSAVAAAPAPPTEVAGDWSWPTDAPHVVVRPYIAPTSDYGAGHRGVDLAAGATVLAPADGTVFFAGRVVDRGVLSIDHGGGVISSYEPVETTLAAGDAVHRGQVVGTIDGGHCPVACLHLGVRVDGQYVSPLLFLGGVPRAVLLPTRRLDP